MGRGHLDTQRLLVQPLGRAALFGESHRRRSPCPTTLISPSSRMARPSGLAPSIAEPVLLVCPHSPREAAAVPQPWLSTPHLPGGGGLDSPPSRSYQPEPQALRLTCSITAILLTSQGLSFLNCQKRGNKKVVTKLQQMKSASFRPRTQWVLPARLLSLHFLSETMPKIPGVPNVFGQGLGLHCQGGHLSQASPEGTHPVSTHVHTGHMRTHSHIYILHIFARVTADLTHTMVIQSSPSDRSPVQLPSHPSSWRGSNPQGLPQIHSEPALDARSLYPNLHRSASATYKATSS